MNEALARATLERVAQLGVREFCVCPGSRNAPWVKLLAGDTTQTRAYYFFEERSAAFFALGRIRATGRPVAVVTTSGTAAAELLPAVVEAHYSGLPLVLMTADRPRRFRGSGSPQSAEQPGLFGIYCAHALDLEKDDGRWPEGITAPLHLNVSFEEPTVAPATRAKPTPPAFASARNPLVIVGGLAAAERAVVRDFLLDYGAPAYVEGPSGLRECDALSPVRVRIGDGIVDRAARAGYEIDGVLRIGSVPTHRMWRDLEDRLPALPVCSVSRLGFPGIARPSEMRAGNVAESLAHLPRANGRASLGALLRADADAAARLDGALDAEPHSEPGMVRALSVALPSGARLFVGNSLPVREWDLAASAEDRGIEVLATRGVNGIDGQVSTFLGLCDPERPNWALIGDLTALYDMAGPWVLPQLDVPRVDLVIMNNAGGMIFDRMYSEREFQNHHAVSFEGLAALWGMQYVRAEAVQPAWRNAPADGRSRLIELRPDAASTQRFWRRYLG